MAISCCFGLRGNLDFPDFLQKKFYNINYRYGQIESVLEATFRRQFQDNKVVVVVVSVTRVNLYFVHSHHTLPNNWTHQIRSEIYLGTALK